MGLSTVPSLLNERGGLKLHGERCSYTAVALAVFVCVGPPTPFYFIGNTYIRERDNDLITVCDTPLKW
jgi:hypothetical protein